MLTIANKGRYVVKKCQKHVYVICEGSLIKKSNLAGAVFNFKGTLREF